ncbi:MAG: hypothetical protein RR248_03685 [Clostridia bacterium]
MFTLQSKLPSLRQLYKDLPLNSTLRAKKLANDKLLFDAITTKNRFVVVCGPCAADDAQAVKEYCNLLAEYSHQLKNILLVPRIITAKPRSLGQGYIGMFFGSSSDNVDVAYGIYSSRKLLLDCLSITDLPLADELLFFEQYKYCKDLISYYFLGARTSESTLHRNFASGLDIPVGVKNNTSGNLTALAQSIFCISNPKTVIDNNLTYLTSGNKLAHACLRGYTFKDINYNNCNDLTLEKLNGLYKQLDIKNNFILIDCSHANSDKRASNQSANAIDAVTNHFDQIGGIMLESYLNCGRDSQKYGYSKIDECISIQETGKLLIELDSIIEAKKFKK